MVPFRRIIAKPGGAHVNRRTIPTASNSTSKSTTTNKQRHRHSLQDWEGHRAAIAKLYITDALKVEEVLEKLKYEHNFPVGYSS